MVPGATLRVKSEPHLPHRGTSCVNTLRPATPPGTGRSDTDREPHPGERTSLSARSCPKSPLALAGPAPTPVSSQGGVSGHAEKPWEAGRHHTEGRVGRKEGPPCSGNRAVTASPGVPPARPWVGHCGHHPPTPHRPPRPQLEGVPGLGLQNAPMPEPSSPDDPPSLGAGQVIFHLRDQ